MLSPQPLPPSLTRPPTTSSAGSHERERPAATGRAEDAGPIGEAVRAAATPAVPWRAGGAAGAAVRNTERTGDGGPTVRYRTRKRRRNKTFAASLVRKKLGNVTITIPTEAALILPGVMASFFPTE